MVIGDSRKGGDDSLRSYGVQGLGGVEADDKL